MIDIEQTLLGDVSICYSGGLDSTTLAYLAAKKGKGKVHLHTLYHGYGYLFNNWIKRTVASLKKALPDDVVSHRYMNTKDLFDLVAMKSLRSDHKKYGQWFGCCLGCTLSAITKIIIYNLENGIPHVFFGSSVGGQYTVMSKPITADALKELCNTYGLIYSSPLIENNIVKEQERELMDSVGIFRGYRFLDKHSFGNQGYCLLSLQHLPDVLLNLHPKYDDSPVQQFLDDKLPICKQFVEDHFKDKGQNLEERIVTIKDITSADPKGDE
ncbi:hypothetical protein H8D64_01050 [PVC group bacterium]|nr:hypothetical protein [PVC group bacterium]